VQARFAALADRDHAEPPWLRPVLQIADKLPVPVLEDVQGQQKAGEEHRAEREQRQRFAHDPTLLRYGRDGPPFAANVLMLSSARAQAPPAAPSAALSPAGRSGRPHAGAAQGGAGPLER